MARSNRRQRLVRDAIVVVVFGAAMIGISTSAALQDVAAGRATPESLAVGAFGTVQSAVNSISFRGPPVEYSIMTDQSSGAAQSVKDAGGALSGKLFDAGSAVGK